MKTQHPPLSSSSAAEPRALRVGLIHNGTLVSERVVPAGVAVTLGTSARNTLCVSEAGAPRSHVLFAPRSGGHTLRWTPRMSGRVASEAGSRELEAGGGAMILDPDSRGKLMLGAWIVLFQQVPAPVAPARAARPMQSILLEEGDPEFLGFLGGFSALALLLVAVVLRTPTPTTVDVEAAPARDIEMVRATPEAPLPRVLTRIIHAVAPRRTDPEDAPTLTRTERKTTPRTPEELEAEVMKRSPWLAVLTTHGDPDQPDGRPDVFEPDDSDGQHLTASLHDVTTAELGPGGPALHGPSSPGEQADLAIGEIGRSGGQTTTVGAGPRSTFHGPSRGEIETVGPHDPLTTDAVRAQVVQYARGIQACYEQELRRTPTLSGRMVLDLHVLAGRVSSVDVSGDNTGSADLEACAVHRASGWHFDTSVTMDLSIPFSLSGS